MSDTATEGAAPSEASAEATEPDTGEATDWAAEAEKWKALAKKHEARAKDNATAAKELEQFRQQSMSEAEKAIEQARTEGRREALAEAGSRIAAAEIRAAANGRMSAEQLGTLLENVNLARFVSDDGEVDREAVTAFVDGIAPPPTEQPASPVDLGQGARRTGTDMALNGDPLLRDLKSKLGVR